MKDDILEISKKIKVQEAADYVTMLQGFLAPGIEMLPLLEDSLKNFKRRADDIMSAAVIIGPDYETKHMDLKFRCERLEALINLLNVYKKSQETITKIAEKRRQKASVNAMFGI